MAVRHWPVEPSRGLVLCLHGVGSTGAEFAFLASRLNERGYDVVCPDWLGHGDSDYLMDANAYRWEVYVRSVVVLINRYNASRVHLLGVSWGGMMLLLYLVGSRFLATSATFVDVPLRANPALLQSTKGMRILSAAAFDTRDEMEALLMSRRPDLRTTPDEWREYLREARFARRNGKYVMKYDQAAISMLETYGSAPFDNFRALDRFKFECLFIYGRFSPFRDPERFRPYLAQYPNIHYSDLLDAAHPPSLFEAHQTAPIEAFLEKVTAANET